MAKTNVSSGSNVLFKIDDDLNRTMTFSAVSSLPMVNEIFSPDFVSFHSDSFPENSLLPIVFSLRTKENLVSKVSDLVDS